MGRITIPYKARKLMNLREGLSIVELQVYEDRQLNPECYIEGEYVLVVKVVSR